MRKFSHTLCLGITLILAGNPPVTGDPGTEDKNAVESPLDEKIRQGLKEYRIRPQDVLRISVENEPDFDQEHVRVYPEPEGLVKYTPLGDVRVVGLALAEVESRIQELLHVFLVDPKVTVSVKEYHSKLVFVLGAVKNPGALDFPPEGSLSLTEAISMAGGLTETGTAGIAEIVRAEESRKKVITLDMTKPAIPLQPNDIVLVREAGR